MLKRSQWNRDLPETDRELVIATSKCHLLQHTSRFVSCYKKQIIFGRSKAYGILHSANCLLQKLVQALHCQMILWTTRCQKKKEREKIFSIVLGTKNHTFDHYLTWSRCNPQLISNLGGKKSYGKSSCFKL